MPENEGRKDRQAARARQDILEAAARAFVRSGFEGTTVEAIAREAGYSPASLYTNFGGKTEIFASLVAYAFEEALAPFDAVPAHRTTFEERLSWLLERLLEFAERRRAVFAVAIDGRLIANTELGPRMMEGGEAVVATARDRVVELMSQGVEEGVLEGRDPRDLATFFTGLLHAFVHRSYHAPDEPPLNERFVLIRDLFLSGARSNNAG